MTKRKPRKKPALSSIGPIMVSAASAWDDLRPVPPTSTKTEFFETADGRTWRYRAGGWAELHEDDDGDDY